MSRAGWFARVLFGAAFALCAHCQSERQPIPTEAYVPLHTHVSADPTKVLDAVEATLAAHRIEVVARDSQRGVVEAVSAPAPTNGTPTRERWWFHVNDGVVHVALHDEMAVRGNPDAGWLSVGGQVCDTYHYARERQLLREIKRRVQADANAAN